MISASQNEVNLEIVVVSVCHEPELQNASTGEPDN